MQSTISSPINSQAGSILIVVMAVIMVLGVLLAFGVDFFKLRSPAEDRRRTLADMTIIVNEIASYVQKNNRIPCPAAPATTTASANFGQETKAGNPSTSCSITEGILPVRTLYLPNRYAKDSWGNYYTYAISPVYADINSTTQVHQNCRAGQWISSGTNINPNKAKFCCPGVNAFATTSDLRVRSINNSYDITGRESSGHSSINTGGSVGSASESVAIVIISHGPNSVGAFLPSGSGTKASGTVDAEETENLDGNRTFIQGLWNLNTGSYFDDIVIYKSQMQLMAHLNDGSCTRPFHSYTPDLMKEDYNDPPILP